MRALAVAVKTDVDLLEREFYAVSEPTDEFIEVPRWIRLLSDRLWFAGPRLKRRDVLVIEAFCIVGAAITFAASFLVPLGARASAVRISAIVPLVCGYRVAVSIRMSDRYKLWPGSQNAPAQTPRTWKSIAAEYTFFVAAGVLGIVMAAWLMVGF